MIFKIVSHKLSRYHQKDVQKIGYFLNNLVEKNTYLILSFILTVPPTIRVIKNVTNRILRCEPDGIPQNYRYYRWQHLSEYRQLIRLLTNNQTIKMEQNSANIDNYKLSGIYVCSANNRVSDINDESTIQTGEVSVLLQGMIYQQISKTI